MHHHALAFNFHSLSPHYAFSLSNFSTQSPNPLLPIFPRLTGFVCLRCRRGPVDISHVYYAALGSSNGKTGGGLVVADKPIAVATLGNLCVDFILSVPELPPPSRQERKSLMDQLSLSPPDKKYWEAGGNCNMAITAARLGLKCVAIGHVGDEIYGEFLPE